MKYNAGTIIFDTELAPKRGECVKVTCRAAESLRRLAAKKRERK